MELDDDGLEVLSSDHCLQLLANRSQGRIGLSVEALPTIIPVDYVLHDDQIVVLASRAAKLSAATRHTVVAFQVDEPDPEHGGAWSVLVRGLARDLPRAAAPALEGVRTRWLNSDDCRPISLSVDLVTGRRVPASVLPVVAVAKGR